MTFPSLFRPDASGVGFLTMIFIILLLSLSTVTVVMTLSSARGARENRQTASKAAILRSAINAYKLNHGGAAGTAPPALADLVTDDAVACVLDNTPGNVATYLLLQGWCGPYIDRPFAEFANDYRTDGWGTTFTYNAGTTVITSCGPDRTCGNADDITFNP